MKRQLIDWEKIFANDATDKGLITKIHKYLYSSITNNPIKKWAEDLNRCLSKEDIEMVNKHMKIYSTSLIIREKSKLQGGVTSHWSIWLSLRKFANNKCWRGCRERGILLPCWWECKLVQPLCKTTWRFL